MASSKERCPPWPHISVLSKSCSSGSMSLIVLGWKTYWLDLAAHEHQQILSYGSRLWKTLTRKCLQYGGCTNNPKYTHIYTHTSYYTEGPSGAVGRVPQLCPDPSPWRRGGTPGNVRTSPKVCLCLWTRLQLDLAKQQQKNYALGPCWKQQSYQLAINGD